MPSGQNFYSILDGDPHSRAPRKRKSDKIDVTSEYFPALETKQFDPNNEAKYIIGNCTSANTKLNNVNCFVIKKCIDAISKEILKASFTKDGSILLLCKNKSVASKFISTKTLKIGENKTIDVQFEFHARLNATKGVIYCPLLKNLSPEEIVEGLRDEHVIEARHITRKLNDSYINSGAVVLTFNRFELPSIVNVCFSRIPVREYVQNPLRCRKCQLLGHTKNHCPADTEKCPRCTLDLNHEGNCSLFCVNCKIAGHGADDKNCASFIVEREVLRIMNKSKCSRYEARKTYFNSNPINPLSKLKTFAATAAETSEKPSPSKLTNKSTSQPSKPPNSPNSPKPTNKNTNVTPQTLPPAAQIKFVKPSTTNDNHSTNYVPIASSTQHNKISISSKLHKTKKLSKQNILRLSANSKEKLEAFLCDPARSPLIKENISLSDYLTMNRSLNLPFEVEISDIGDVPMN